jgi:hypothetical protein
MSIADPKPIDQLQAPAGRTASAAGRRRLPRRRWIAGTAILLGLLGWLLSYATTSDGSITNPSPPHPLRSLHWASLSVDHFWVPVFYIVTAGLMALMAWIFLKHWRVARSVHPGAFIFVAFVPQLVMDPI